MSIVLYLLFLRCLTIDSVAFDPTFFIADTEPLLQITNPIKAYIQGRELDLTDRQKNLWEKYKEKYRRLGRLNE